MATGTNQTERAGASGAMANLRGRWLVTPEALALAAPVATLFLIETFISKLMQLGRIRADLSPIEFLQVWVPDAAVAGGAAALFTFLLSVLGRRWRIVVTTLMFVFWTWSLLLTAVGHGYFSATGAVLSWSMVRHWFLTMADSSFVMASEASAGRLTFLLAQPMIIVCCVVVPHIRPVRRWLEGRRRWLLTARRAIVYCGISATAVVGLVLVPGPHGGAVSLANSLSVGIIKELVLEELLPEPEIEVLESERLDGSIEFATPSNSQRMNVVLFVFESLRAASSDVYVPGLGTTPFMAELAKRGAMVEHHYTVVPHTTKALVPIHCGFYPALTADAKETTPGILPRRCLPHILRKFGYETAYFQSAGNFEKRDALVANMGYETYRGAKDMPSEGFEDTCYFGKEERIMLRPSMDWIDSLDGSPFLLSYLTLSTHHNYVSPQSFPHTDYGVDDHDLNNYMNAVRYTDEFLKEVYQELELRGLADKTLFVVVGDHGEAFGEHGRRQHDHVMWEEGLRSAAVYVAPGIIEPGSVIAGPGSLLDIAPTVCDVLGLDLTKGTFVGRSLLGAPEPDRKLFHSCWFKRECLAIIEGRLKYIYYYGKRPEEVYDLTADPQEQNNLAHSGLYTPEFLRSRKDEATLWERKVNKQYDEWLDNVKTRAVVTAEPAVSNKLSASFDGKIEFVGYQVDKTSVDSGQDVALEYVFKSVEPLEPGWKMLVHVKHERGGFKNADHVPAGGSHPVSKWEPGEYVIDKHTVHIPGTWPSGKARVMIGFYSNEEGRIPVSAAEAEIDDKRLVVTTLDIRESAKAPVMTLDQRRLKIAQWIGFDRLEPETRTDIVFGGKVELVGADLVKMQARQSGTARMNYAFHALENVPANWKLTVRLIRDDGATINGDHVPIGGLYPPGDWRKGEYVLDRHRLLIEYPKHKPGSYGVYLGFRAGGKPVSARGTGEFDGESRVRLGTIVVEAFKP